MKKLLLIGLFALLSLAGTAQQQVIGIGSAPNDGTGDPLRTAMTKINANFSEMYYPTANRQTASYQLLLTDQAKVVEMNVAGANDLTVPPNGTIAFPVGSYVTAVQYGAGLTTVVAGVGVTIRSSSGTLLSPGQYCPMVLRKVATNEWYLWNGSPAFAAAALTDVDDTNVLLTLGGNPSTALLAAASITAGWSGQLGLSRGGTGFDNTTQSYSPTITSTANLTGTATANNFRYTRVGNNVTVSGVLTGFDPTTTATLTTLGISLPIASAFSTAFQCSGAGASIAVTDGAIAINSDATNDRAQLTYVCVDTTSHTVTVWFQYEVL